MPEPIVVIVATVAAVVGLLLGFFARQPTASNAIKRRAHSQRLVAEARAKQKEIVLEGKDEAIHLRRAAEDEAREQRANLQRPERRLPTGRRRSIARWPRSRSARRPSMVARPNLTRNADGWRTSTSAGRRA